MSNAGKFKDYTPFLRNAGVTTATESVRCDHSLRQDLYFKVNYNVTFRQELKLPNTSKSIENQSEKFQVSSKPTMEYLMIPSLLRI
jgi:hypothetical protein